MIIKYESRFNKSYKKLNINIQLKFDEKLRLFINEPFNPTLRNHSLKGKLKGKRSINISGDLRVIFKEYPDGTYEFVDFINIGTHSQLY